MLFLNIMCVVICILLIISIILSVLIVLNEKHKNVKDIKKEFDNSLSLLSGLLSDNINKENTKTFQMLKENIDNLNNQITNLNKINIEYQQLFNQTINQRFGDISISLEKNNEILAKDVKNNTSIIKEKLDGINNSVDKNLENIRKDNNEKLEKIQGIVDEKLQKTLQERLNNSFNNVIEQIGGVNKAIGEIKGIASDVGSLKTILTNVKTKGIVGEVILGSLIREILTPIQYEENVATKRNSADRVEYAIKMPNDQGEFIYLPVDSKFPTESYYKILECIDNGDKAMLESARKELRTRIKNFAKDISEKYIDEPYTTGFAIMFLPLEGLYVEVINMGLSEELQRDYKVNIAGPSTFSALLNALQIGFKTMIIQKKSADVFKLLGAIKTEFNKFAGILEKAQKKVNDASDELDSLVGARTKAIQRKLKEFEEIPDSESEILLGIKKGG